MQEIDIRSHIDADPATVWSLLDDSTSWPSWTPIDTCQIVIAAPPEKVGEIRVFRNGRHTVREEIVERRQGLRLSYTLLAGLALRDYRADIDLAPGQDGGTDLRWHTVFDAKVPGSGWIYLRALRDATQSFVDGLTTVAARERGSV